MKQSTRVQLLVIIICSLAVMITSSVLAQTPLNVCTTNSDCGQEKTCSNGLKYYEVECKNNVCEQVVFAGGTPCFNETIGESRIVKEKVKCVFLNSSSAQKCYSIDEQRNSKYSCSSDKSDNSGQSLDENSLLDLSRGTTCIVDGVEGLKGSTIGWKSSCGGYATTLLDGDNKYAIFYCSKEEVQEDNLFSGASWQCHGFQETERQGISVKDSNGASGSCQSSEAWQQYAKEACAGSCSKETGKCGVNSFSVGDSCGKTVIINPTIDSKVPVDITDKKEVGTTISCNGCLSDNKCYPFGYRKSGEYCSDNNIFTTQLQSDVQCDNNFQCGSNVCVSGKCISPGLLDSIISWFQKLFGNK